MENKNVSCYQNSIYGLQEVYLQTGVRETIGWTETAPNLIVLSLF